MDGVPGYTGHVPLPSRPRPWCAKTTIATRSVVDYSTSPPFEPEYPEDGSLRPGESILIRNPRDTTYGADFPPRRYPLGHPSIRSKSETWTKRNPRPQAAIPATAVFSGKSEFVTTAATHTNDDQSGAVWASIARQNAAIQEALLAERVPGPVSAAYAHTLRVRGVVGANRSPPEVAATANTLAVAIGRRTADAAGALSGFETAFGFRAASASRKTTTEGGEASNTATDSPGGAARGMAEDISEYTDEYRPKGVTVGVLRPTPVGATLAELHAAAAAEAEAAAAAAAAAEDAAAAADDDHASAFSGAASAAGGAASAAGGRARGTGAGSATGSAAAGSTRTGRGGRGGRLRPDAQPVDHYANREAVYAERAACDADDVHHAAVGATTSSWAARAATAARADAAALAEDNDRAAQAAAARARAANRQQLGGAIAALGGPVGGAAVVSALEAGGASTVTSPRASAALPPLAGAPRGSVAMKGCDDGATDSPVSPLGASAAPPTLELGASSFAPLSQAAGGTAGLVRTHTAPALSASAPAGAGPLVVRSRGPLGVPIKLPNNTLPHGARPVQPPPTRPAAPLSLAMSASGRHTRVARAAAVTADDGHVDGLRERSAPDAFASIPRLATAPVPTPPTVSATMPPRATTITDTYKIAANARGGVVRFTDDPVGSTYAAFAAGAFASTSGLQPLSNRLAIAAAAADDAVAATAAAGGAGADEAATDSSAPVVGAGTAGSDAPKYGRDRYVGAPPRGSPLYESVRVPGDPLSAIPRDDEGHATVVKLHVGYGDDACATRASYAAAAQWGTANGRAPGSVGGTLVANSCALSPLCTTVAPFPASTESVGLSRIGARGVTTVGRVDIEAAAVASVKKLNRVPGNTMFHPHHHTTAARMRGPADDLLRNGHADPPLPDEPPLRRPVGVKNPLSVTHDALERTRIAVEEGSSGRAIMAPSHVNARQALLAGGAAMAGGSASNSYLQAALRGSAAGASGAAEAAPPAPPTAPARIADMFSGNDVGAQVQAAQYFTAYRPMEGSMRARPLQRQWSSEPVRDDEPSLLLLCTIYAPLLIFIRRPPTHLMSVPQRDLVVVLFSLILSLIVSLVLSSMSIPTAARAQPARGPYGVRWLAPLRPTPTPPYYHESHSCSFTRCASDVGLPPCPPVV